MNKVAIYGRVSTSEQNVDNQVIELKKYCENRGLEIFDIYLDKGVSGSKESRPEFNRMMLDASKRKFNLLLVWKLDRLSRSLKHLLNTLDTLQTLNISFICYSDNIDTTTPAGKLMFHMVGAFAEFERELIRERVKLGLSRARSKGVKLGRPKLKVNKYKILQMKNSGYTVRQIAKELGISIGSVSKISSKQI